MNKENKSFLGPFIKTSVFMILFLLVLVLVKTVDVAKIGENNTDMGLSTINDAFYQQLKTINEPFYKITKYMGYMCFAVIAVFAVIGLVQLIKRKSLLKVDKDILVLGGTYIFVLLLYFFFDLVPFSVRPIIVDEAMEASFPSSHTLMAIVVMGTLIQEVILRVSNKWLKIVLCVLSLMFILVMVVLRTLSGVHWITDIVSGVLLGLSVIYLYQTILFKISSNEVKQ